MPDTGKPMLAEGGVLKGQGMITSFSQSSSTGESVETYRRHDFDTYAPIGLTSVLRSLLELAVRITRAEGGTLFLMEGDGSWVPVAHLRPPEKYPNQDKIPLHGSLWKIASSFESGPTPDMGEPPEPYTEEMVEGTWKLRIKIPINAGPLGVLELTRAGKRAFSEEERMSAVLLADRTADLISAALTLSRVEENRRRLEAVLQSIGEGVFALDGMGRLIFANPSAERLLGLPPIGNIHGPHLEELPLDGSVRDLLSRSLREGRELVEEIRLSPPERVLQVETRLFSVTGDGNQGLVAVVRDITESKELERMREEFVSTLSHELRTPLTSIKAYAATLRRPDVSFDGDTQREFLAIIEGEADRLARLIRDLLDTSRAESNRLELRTKEVDLARLAEMVLERMRPQAGTHRLRLVSGSQPVFVRADADRIEQVITNLLDNALKYSPAGSTVTLSVEAKGRTAVLSVSDQGMGIPEDQQNQIFEKFHRVRDRENHRVPGTGLGLYLCRKIVEAHGGKIWVESAPGRGSTFYFSLPLMGVDGDEAASETDAINLSR